MLFRVALAVFKLSEGAIQQAKSVEAVLSLISSTTQKALDCDAFLKVFKKEI